MKGRFVTMILNNFVKIIQILMNANPQGYAGLYKTREMDLTIASIKIEWVFAMIGQR